MLRVGAGDRERLVGVRLGWAAIPPPSDRVGLPCPASGAMLVGCDADVILGSVSVVGVSAVVSVPPRTGWDDGLGMPDLGLESRMRLSRTLGLCRDMLARVGDRKDCLARLGDGALSSGGGDGTGEAEGRPRFGVGGGSMAIVVGRECGSNTRFQLGSVRIQDAGTG